MGSNVMGGGGHGSGRNIPGKTEFPPDWSDDRTIEVIEDIANDPASQRAAAGDGRTCVCGARDGVDVEVYIARDRRSVVTAYPKNTSRNLEAAPTWTQDWREIESDLLALSNIVSLPTDSDKNQLKTLIHVGEYDLALDNIAHFFARDDSAVPCVAFEIIEWLAAALDTASDPEYAAVARLLAIERPRT